MATAPGEVMLRAERPLFKRATAHLRSSVESLNQEIAQFKT